MKTTNFFVAGMIAAACIFSGCSDRTVATTSETYPADDMEETTSTDEDYDAASDESLAGAEADTAAYEQEVVREDVAATGDELEMENMNAAGTEADLEGFDEPTRALLMPLQDMMEQLRMHESSGSVDQDFAAMMIVHHQGAINMSEQLLQSGDNQEILDRARQLVDARQQEITRLEAFSTDPAGMEGDAQQATSGQTENTEATQQLRTATEGTLQQLQQENLNGDADHDYAHVLILHLQDAIEMAEIELEHGQNAELKAMAQQMVDENTTTISELETWAGSNSR